MPSSVPGDSTPQEMPAFEFNQTHLPTPLLSIERWYLTRLTQTRESPSRIELTMPLTSSTPRPEQNTRKKTCLPYQAYLLVVEAKRCKDVNSAIAQLFGYLAFLYKLRKPHQNLTRDIYEITSLVAPGLQLLLMDLHTTF